VKSAVGARAHRHGQPRRSTEGSPGTSGRVAGETADREGREMNAVDVGAWNADLAWSLPLIVLNVVIHVIGLGLINESVVRVLSGALPHRRFMPTFAVGMGAAVLLATALHGIEAATWATAYRLLGALPDTKSAILYSLSALTRLRPREHLSGRAMATNGCSGGAERDASVRADHRLSVRHDSEGLATGKQRAASGDLEAGVTRERWPACTAPRQSCRIRYYPIRL